MTWKHGHISVSVGYLEERLRDRERAGKPQDILLIAGQPDGYQEAYQHLAELRGQEILFITSPDCDNVLPDGSCGMHDGPAPKS